MRMLCLIVCAVACCCLSACNGPIFGYPRGTMQQQQHRAVLRDPFYDQDVGPEVVGGRPRGLDKPLAEPARVQVQAGVR